MDAMGMFDNDVKELCHLLLLKRSVDGLNGRIWDASKHLEYETLIVETLRETQSRKASWMNSKEIAEQAKECAEQTGFLEHFRGGGNMGSMFIAQAIETHARAVLDLSCAIQALASGLEGQTRPSNVSVEVKIPPETIEALGKSLKRKEEDDGK